MNEACTNVHVGCQRARVDSTWPTEGRRFLRTLHLETPCLVWKEMVHSLSSLSWIVSVFIIVQLFHLRSDGRRISVNVSSEPYIKRTCTFSVRLASSVIEWRTLAVTYTAPEALWNWCYEKCISGFLSNDEKKRYVMSQPCLTLGGEDKITAQIHTVYKSS